MNREVFGLVSRLFVYILILELHSQINHRLNKKKDTERKRERPKRRAIINT